MEEDVAEPAPDEIQTVIDPRALEFGGQDRSVFLDPRGELGITDAAIPIISGWGYAGVKRLYNEDNKALVPLVEAMFNAIIQTYLFADSQDEDREQFKTCPPIPDGFEECLRCGTSWKSDETLPFFQKRHEIKIGALPDLISRLDTVADLASNLAKRYQDELDSAVSLKRDINEHLAHAEADGRFRGFVYLIENAARRIVKIGYSLDPTGRLAGLQTAVPDELRLLHSFPGSPFEERALHQRFKEHGVGREWFRKADEIIDVFKKYEQRRASNEKSDEKAA